MGHVAILFFAAACIAAASAGAANTKLDSGVPVPSQPNATIQAPEYVVNLDLAPEDRWTEVVTLYKSSAPLIVAYFTGVLPPAVTKLLETIMGDLDGYLGEYGAEMRGVAKVLWMLCVDVVCTHPPSQACFAKAYGLDLGVIVALNFAYELRKWGGGHQNITGEYYPKVPQTHTHTHTHTHTNTHTHADLHLHCRRGQEQCYLPWTQHGLEPPH